MSFKYDDVKVTSETSETRESYLLLVHIPEGFQRQHIVAKVEFEYGRVRVYGELPPENNVIRRFTEVHKVPGTCDINNIRGKLDGRIITITMRKREISEVPEQESQPPAQEAPKTPVQQKEPESDKDEEGTQTQPQPGEHQQEEPTDDEEGDQKDQEEPTSDEEGDQEDQEEPTTDDEEGDQKDQEGLSEQSPKSPIDNKEKAHIETPTQPAEATEKSRPEMDQKWVPQKATFEDSQKEEIEKKSFERGKQPEKAVLDKSPATEEENNRKRKASSAFVAYVPKTAGNNQETVVPESTAKRMTFLEDKRKLIYMGVAFAVMALGVYATYKLRSSARK